MTTELDLTPRYVPTKLISATANGFRELPVLEYVFHPAGTHPNSPIKNEMGAIECVMAPKESRWFGCVEAYIDSSLRMVIVGTNPRDEVRMKWEKVPARETVKTARV